MTFCCMRVLVYVCPLYIVKRHEKRVPSKCKYKEDLFITETSICRSDICGAMYLTNRFTKRCLVRGIRKA